MEATVSYSEAKLADAWGERAILAKAAPKLPVKETHASRTSPAGAVGHGEGERDAWGEAAELETTLLTLTVERNLTEIAATIRYCILCEQSCFANMTQAKENTRGSGPSQDLG